MSYHSDDHSHNHSHSVNNEQTETIYNPKAKFLKPQDSLITRLA